jgi:hypothetical protein
MPSRNAALYELFKALYYAEQDRVEAERASKGEDTTLKSSDVPRCISGKSGAPIEERPFDRVLNREHILSCVEKVGLPPSTENRCAQPYLCAERRETQAAGTRTREQLSSSACTRATKIQLQLAGEKASISRR